VERSAFLPTSAEATERHTIPMAGGSLTLVLHLPAVSPAPCVVACHGLGASKDSDKYQLLGVELPSAGLALARFDFRGCGESSGVETDTTVASRIEDVRPCWRTLHDTLGSTAASGSLAPASAVSWRCGRASAGPVGRW
jgi:predicted alpha/beta-hydrolase family hydrolase